MPSPGRREENDEAGDPTTSRRQQDLSDLQEIERAFASGDEAIPLEQAKEELRAQGVDV